MSQSSVVNMVTPEITDVVFDFCDVLIDWQPRLALEGQYPEDIVDMFFDLDDPWGFEFYDALSDSGWSEERILADYEAHHGPAVAWMFHVYFERQELALKGMMPDMTELLGELDAAGVRLWGLTNFTTKFVAMSRRHFAPLGLLRDVVISSEEGLLKPDPNIYRTAIQRFGIDPTHTVFTDDKAHNAEGATALGMHSVVFRNAGQLRATLSDLGVGLT